MSSLILLVIVAAWAVVLVPMLLNRHDAASEARSVDRFATAMRVLARRPAGDRRYVVVPRRPDSSPSVVVNGTSQWATEAAEARRRVADDEERRTESAEVRAGRDPELARRGVIARRRRLVIGLAAVAVLLLPLALTVAPVLWAGQVLIDLLLAAFVVHVRRETARMRARRARAAQRARRAAEQMAAAHAAATARADAPPIVTPSNAVIIERQEDGSWHPVPVPLPTYVTAPPAPPLPAAPSAPAASAGLAADRPLTAEEHLDHDLDEMERRLAVND